MKQKAILAFATGPHEVLLEIALPSFKRFARKHGYDLVIPKNPDRDRAPSWWKIPALQETLDSYTEVLYLDADTVIIDHREDLNVPEWFWQAMVRHHTLDGEVPNCGVWLVRQQMKPVLEQVWGMTEYLDHGWWEQAAMLELMGYRTYPARPLIDTELYQRTFFLENGWNVHCRDVTEVKRQRIMHATMHPDRVAVMREWAGQKVPVPA